MRGCRKSWSLALPLLAAVSSPLIAQALPSLEARAATVIALNSRIIDTSRPEPEAAEAMNALALEPGGDEIVLVKFACPRRER